VLSASVVVTCADTSPPLAECLAGLVNQEPRPAEVIVVHRRGGAEIAGLRAEFPDVRFVEFEGKTDAARNAGLARAGAEVVAFIDSDCVAQPGWLASLLENYRNPAVAAVGGRLVEPSGGTNTLIGLALPNGTLATGFDRDPGRTIQVEHLSPANASFRRESLDAAGGFGSHYAGDGGTGVTELCLRLHAGGQRICFAPGAVVRKPAADRVPPFWPDLRADYRVRRDHVLLLALVHGTSAKVVRNYLTVAVREEFDCFARMRARSGPVMADGTPRLLSRRLTAPVVVGRGLAGVTGLVAGLAVAVKANAGRKRGG